MAAIPKEIGKYRIERVLGRGGMGEVYQAFDPTLGRFVALKMLRSIALDDTNARERFIREAQSAGGLRHPNIVTIYDLGEVADQMFIAMELIEGEDLEKTIKEKAPLPIEDKLNIMIQVSEGMAYAHKRDIVHRDLKPSNIRVDENGVAKIMDFGIAKLGSSNLTASGMVMGTPHYMSPEQVRGTRVDSRSDIFSLGSILYELFAYQKAFSGEMTAVFYKIAHEKPKPLANYLDIPCEPLQEIIDRCLEKEKSERLQSAPELAELLRKAQQVYRQNNQATLSGIKTAHMPDGISQSHKTPSPAAVTNPSRNSMTSAQTMGPDVVTIGPEGTDPTDILSRAPGSLPTQHIPAIVAPPAPMSPQSAPIKPGPAPVPAPPAVAPVGLSGPEIPVISAQQDLAGSTVPAAKPSSMRPVIIVLLLVIVGLAGAGFAVYYSLFRPHDTATSKKELPGQTPTPVPNPPAIRPPDGTIKKLDVAAELNNAKQLYQSGKYPEAIRIYENLIQADPSNANVFYFSGAARLKAGQKDDALRDFEKAVELNPQFDKAWLQIGFLRMSQVDYSGAEKAFLKVIEVQPESPSGWQGLAQTYLMSQQTDKAENAYEKLLQLDPENVTAIFNLGQIEWAGKKTEAARKSFLRVLELDPDYAEAHNNLGAIFLSEGNLPSAIRENEAAIRLKPGLASAHYSLFLAFEQKKDLKKAASHLKEYMDLSGDDDAELQKKLKQYESGKP